DLVDHPTPRYGIIVVVIEQLPGLWRWIDEDPAFECKVLVQAVDLILVEYRVHVFRDIDVEFVVGNPLTLHDFDDDLQIVKDHGDLPALAMKHLANHIPHRLSPSDDKKCNTTLPGVERVTKDAFGVQSLPYPGHIVPRSLTLAVSRADSRSEGRAKAVGRRLQCQTV